MGRPAVIIAVILLATACGAVASPVASPSATPASPPSPSAGTPQLTGTYGLLLSAGNLELVTTSGAIAANVPVTPPSVQYCSSQHDRAILAPPASASNAHVYFRDGDNKIRMVVPPASAVDVTTVPGSATTVSFFSVSPDDQRIAVLVEDLSGGKTIKLRLYVEDLNGGGHRADIYTTTTPNGRTGTTLWPVGWHQGQLVLAVWTACSSEQPANPSAYHIVDASNANRKTNIAGNCHLSPWPSPGGMACVDTPKLHLSVYDWAGKSTNEMGICCLVEKADQGGVSPSGVRMFLLVPIGSGIEAPPPSTYALTFNSGGAAVTIPGHPACIWIDNEHMLTPDSVLEYPSGTVTVLPAAGVCAGRFPGEL